MDLALIVLGDNPWPDLDVLSELQYTSENRASSYTTL